jgi:hypothetical protein
MAASAALAVACPHAPFGDTSSQADIGIGVRDHCRQRECLIPEAHSCRKRPLPLTARPDYILPNSELPRAVFAAARLLPSAASGGA